MPCFSFASTNQFYRYERYSPVHPANCLQCRVQQLGTQNIQQLIDLEIGLANTLMVLLASFSSNEASTLRNQNGTPLRGSRYRPRYVLPEVNFRDNIERWHLFLSLHF